MIWLILSAIAAGLFWYHFVRPMNHFKSLGVPTGNPLPFFGDQFDNVIKKTSFYDWIKILYDRHPGKRYSGFYQFILPTLMLRDPELIKQITVKDFDHFTDHRSFADPDADPVWGGNLFSLKGQKWREMRATLSGSYTSSKMRNMFSLMNEAAANFVQFFIDKREDLLEIELKDTFTRYTNDVIATAAFGIKVDSLKEPNNDFYLMGKKVTNFSGFLNRMKFFAFVIFPTLFKIFKITVLPRDATHFFSSIIEETIKTREKEGIVRQDMINQLLEARRGKEAKSEEPETETGFATVKESDMTKFRQIKTLTNADITSQALIFFFAGFDTISTALCFAAYELVVNEQVQDKLRNEINDTWKSTNGKITYDVLLKMKYLDLVISETLRKWPPASGVDRVVTKPYTIEPATPDECPVPLKPGDILFLPILGLHRDPEYFPDPDKFDPERFNDENKDNIQPYTYIPFGSGPRNCIGSRFALLETKALLFQLLLNFYIVPIQKTRIPLKLDVNSFNPKQEGGFWFGLKRIHMITT